MKREKEKGKKKNLILVVRSQVKELTTVDKWRQFRANIQ